MDSALERIEFLASSKNRVEVLRTLDTELHDARDLVAETDGFRSTIGRVLNEFDARGWIERRNSGYGITELGALILAEFEPLLETMDRAEVLEEAVRWLPTEELSLDLYELGDGTLIYPSEKNLSAHIEHGLDMARAGSRLLIVCNAVLPQGVKTARDCAIDGRLTTAQVYGDAVMEIILDHEQMSKQIRELIEAGNPVYRYPGSLPYNMLVVDETVLFFLCDETDLPAALLKTDNETVLTWAESAFDSYRSEADSLEREVLA